MFSIHFHNKISDSSNYCSTEIASVKKPPKLLQAQPLILLAIVSDSLMKNLLKYLIAAARAAAANEARGKKDD